MRRIFLPTMQTIILDIVMWVIFHFSIGYLSARIPIQKFNPDNFLFKTHKWEKNGLIYDKIFKVKSWKGIIPSGAALYTDAYEVRHINDFSVENLKVWVQESCRSEFCHILMIFPGFLFFLWNSIEIGWVMVGYAVLNNIIPIIMQRYNRPRVKKMLQYMERSKKYSLPVEIRQEFQESSLTAQ